MPEPAYPAARAVATRIADHFKRHLAAARARGRKGLAAVPDTETIEALIDAAFWASLRREEGATPKISLAYLPPDVDIGRRVKAGETLLWLDVPDLEAQKKQKEALLEQARTTVRGGDLGQRIETLNAIRRAAAISNTLELRREAFAALALPDLRFKQELPTGLDLERLEARYRNGVLEVHVPRTPGAVPRRIEVKT